MKTVDTTVNISMRYPVSEKKLSEIIKSGKTDNKYLAHIFALFTDVPASDFLAFIKKYDISLPTIKKYYFKHVKKFYPNAELENVFTFK
jgi:hypothetical protein